MSTYSLADLCQLGDVSPRTVRYYVANGLLRPPKGAGPAARYDDDHLHRLRLIRQLQRDHLPLSEIRARLAALSDDEVQRAAEGPAPATDSAADYIGRVLASRGLPTAQRLAVAPSTAAPSTAAPSTAAPSTAAPSAAAPSTPSRALARTAATVPSPHHAVASPATGYETPQPEAALGKEPGRSQWERVAINPDIEIHIRRPLSREANKRVDRLIAIAHQLLEDPS